MQDLKVNDIITFKNRGEVITHRISEIDEQTQKIRTKGDKNTLNDVEAIKYEDIEGVYVFKISNFEKISNIVKNTTCWFFIFLIILTVFLHNRRINRKRSLRRKKKKDEDKKAKLAQEDNSKNIE
jgi:signal peptidase I